MQSVWNITTQSTWNVTMQSTWTWPHSQLGTDHTVNLEHDHTVNLECDHAVNLEYTCNHTINLEWDHVINLKCDHAVVLVIPDSKCPSTFLWRSSTALQHRDNSGSSSYGSHCYQHWHIEFLPSEKPPAWLVSDVILYFEPVFQLAQSSFHLCTLSSWCLNKTKISNDLWLLLLASNVPLLQFTIKVHAHTNPLSAQLNQYLLSDLLSIGREAPL